MLDYEACVVSILMITVKSRGRRERCRSQRFLNYARTIRFSIHDNCFLIDFFLIRISNTLILSRIIFSKYQKAIGVEVPELLANGQRFSIRNYSIFEFDRVRIVSYLYTLILSRILFLKSAKDLRQDRS